MHAMVKSMTHVIPWENVVIKFLSLFSIEAEIMSAPSDYIKTLHADAINRIVAALLKEKVGRQGSESACMGRKLYQDKFAALASMGITISYTVLAQRVSCEFKSHKVI